MYDAAMVNGKRAIRDNKYSEAETNFQEAIHHQNNDMVAHVYLDQTQNLVLAESNMQNGNFDMAHSNYNKVKDANNGSIILVKRAKIALNNLHNIRLKYDTYKQIYYAALTQYMGQQYISSNSTLNQLFNDVESKQSYYYNIYNKAIKLRTINNKYIKNKRNGTPRAKSSTNNFRSSNNSNNVTAISKSSSTTGITDDEMNASKKYKGKNEYTVDKKRKEINGKKITAMQVKEGRNKITSNGLEEGSFSDQDVRDGLIAAHKKGITYSQYLNNKYK